MHRRSLLRALLLAPITLPFAAKAMAEPSSSLEIGHVDIADIAPPTGRWIVEIDDSGYVTGLEAVDHVPAFAVETVDGKPRIVIRDGFIDHLNRIAAEQNARLG